MLYYLKNTHNLIGTPWPLTHCLVQKTNKHTFTPFITVQTWTNGSDKNVMVETVDMTSMAMTSTPFIKTAFCI